MNAAISLSGCRMGYEVKLVDEAGQPVPPGVGQIAILARPGWTIMKGYFENPEATQTIRNDWL
ncbi:MAG: hypothetical protein U0401_14015 [Anaerolineae bacterium]